MFYKKLKVMTRYKKLNQVAQVSIAEKEIKRMTPVLNVGFFHAFFLRYKIIFLGFIFNVNNGGNQHSFCDILIKNFGNYMIENYFKICQKCKTSFYKEYYMFCFKKIWFSSYLYVFSLSYVEEKPPD